MDIHMTSVRCVLMGWSLDLGTTRLLPATPSAAVEGPSRGAAYCIRLANDDVPWDGGVNVLGDVEVFAGAG